MYRAMKTSGNGLLCSLYAVIASMSEQYPSIRPQPTLNELNLVRDSLLQGWSGIFGDEKVGLKENNLTVDQIAQLPNIWCRPAWIRKVILASAPHRSCVGDCDIKGELRDTSLCAHRATKRSIYFATISSRIILRIWPTVLSSRRRNYGMQGRSIQGGWVGSSVSLIVKLIRGASSW